MVESIIGVSLVLLVIGCVITLVRAAKGPTNFDRGLAGNAFTTQIVLIISLYSYSTGHPEYIDIAILYALINYVGTLALVRFLNQTKEVAND